MDNNQLNNELDIKFDLNIDNNMDFNLDTDFGSDFGLDVDWGDKLQVDIPDITVSMPQTEIPEQPQPKVYEPPKAVRQSAYAYPGAGKQGLNGTGQPLQQAKQPQQQYENVKPHLQQQSYEAQQTKSWTGANGRSQSAGNQSNAGTYNQYSFDAVFKSGNNVQSRTPIEGTDRVMYTKTEYRTEQQFNKGQQPKYNGPHQTVTPPRYNQQQYNQPQYKRAQEYTYHNHNNGDRREYMSSVGGQNNNDLQTGIKRAAIIFVGVVVLMIILMLILTI